MPPKILLTAAFLLLFSQTAQTENPLTPTHGQIWHTYDISRYTSQINTLKKPETAVLDWILLETGFETWHSEIPAMLTVTPTEVRVFHVPAVQQKVADVVTRLVGVNPNQHSFQVQLFTVNSPNWRQKFTKELTPIPSRTPGSQAWDIAAEDLRGVVKMFESQTGFSRLSTQMATVPNGQAQVITLSRNRTYTRSYIAGQGFGKTPEADEITFDDGFSFEYMPLLSVDGGTIDIQLKCQINHLERFISLYLTPAGGLEKKDDRKISLPVIGQYRFRERYQWDSGKSLLVSLGFTPQPMPSGSDSRPGIPGLGAESRMEMLVLIEYRNRN